MCCYPEIENGKQAEKEGLYLDSVALEMIMHGAAIVEIQGQSSHWKTCASGKMPFPRKRGRITWVNSNGNIAVEADDNLATCFNGHIKSNGLHPELSRSTECAIKPSKVVPETGIPIDR